jgi:hypothetical protein
LLHDVAQVVDTPPLASTTLPEPVTVRPRSKPWVKVAVTERAALSVVAQVKVPVQAPDQLLKVQPDAGVAVSVTLLPET